MTLQTSSILLETEIKLSDLVLNNKLSPVLPLKRKRCTKFATEDDLKGVVS